eukprot:m.1201196 g.1201196  ORF g.1201196 m.1201196 type:complete len:130 (-) comp24574_c0_seq65:1459-1848(-)
MFNMCRITGTSGGHRYPRGVCCFPHDCVNAASPTAVEATRAMGLSPGMVADAADVAGTFCGCVDSVGSENARASVDSGDNTLVGVPADGDSADPIETVSTDEATTVDNGDGGVRLSITGERTGGTGAWW